MGREGRPHAHRRVRQGRLRRDRRREDPVGRLMQRVIVLGGGVGGTLAANLIARKLKREISAGKAKVTVVDATGSHAYQPGYMYIAMGNEKPQHLVRPEKSLLDKNVELVVDSVTGIDAPGCSVSLGSGVTMAF